VLPTLGEPVPTSRNWRIPPSRCLAYHGRSLIVAPAGPARQGGQQPAGVEHFIEHLGLVFGDEDLAALGAGDPRAVIQGTFAQFAQG
jgi:hypothetical protein